MVSLGKRSKDNQQTPLLEIHIMTLKTLAYPESVPDIVFYT